MPDYVKLADRMAEQTCLPWMLRVEVVEALREAEIKVAVAEIKQLNDELHPHTFCLNCGLTEPCNLDKEETSIMPPGKWPGSPCLFEPTPRQLFDCCKAQREEINRLKDEIIDLNLACNVRKETCEQLSAELEAARSRAK